MDAAPGTFAAILDALGSGLPKLIIQFVTCAVLLAIGVAIYVRVTPFREREMVEHGNAAAGTMPPGRSWRWRSRWRRCWQRAALFSTCWSGASWR